MTELWKQYTDTIEVSNLGNVRYLFTNEQVHIRYDSEGYKCFSTFEIRKVRVHRVVAILFVPNPDNKSIVSFKNGNKNDTNANNLVWCTQKEKCALNSKFHHYSTKKTVWNEPITAISASDNSIHHFKNQSKAALRLNLDNSEINKCLKGKRKTSHGYYFYYAKNYKEDNKMNNQQEKKTRGKRYAIDIDALNLETDVYNLSAICKIDTATLRNSLKKNMLTAYQFNALKNGGFDITKYWIKDSNINTLQVKEDLIYECITSSKKVNSACYKIDGFMNTRLYKPLHGYMEFCDMIKAPYSMFCDDEDYAEFLQSREKVIADDEVKNQSEDKPKAFIKTQSKDISTIPVIKVHWNELSYKNDLRSIVTTVSHCDDIATIISNNPILSKYSELLIQDIETAFYVKHIEEAFNVELYKPTYAKYLLKEKNIAGIYMAQIKNIINEKGNI